MAGAQEATNKRLCNDNNHAKKGRLSDYGQVTQFLRASISSSA